MPGSRPAPGRPRSGRGGGPVYVPLRVRGPVTAPLTLPISIPRWFMRSFAPLWLALAFYAGAAAIGFLLLLVLPEVCRCAY